MTATLSPPAEGSTEDRVGAVEAAGVEYLPEEARDSGPRNLAAVFLGANLTWTNVVFGAFAILFGLSFWQTVTSMAVGTAVGTLAVLPTAIIGPRTGTNMTVSSGAFFGIRGRFIGSGLALAIALGFAAVTVWTSGDAIVAAGHRLLGTPENDIVHAVAYAAVAALMVTVALYGHATIVAIQKVGRANRRRAHDHRGVRVRGRLRSRRFERRVCAGRVLADLGTVGSAVRGRADLLRADDRRLHPADLVNSLQQQADLHRARRRHVRRRAAAQPVRRLHGYDVRQPDRLLHRRPGRRIARLVRRCRSW